jgi:hypothetical protein
MSEEKIYLTGRPDECPKCGKKPVAYILYGLPDFSPELEKKCDEGKVVLGGCVVSDDDPKWQCTGCRANFYKKR